MNRAFETAAATLFISALCLAPLACDDSEQRQPASKANAQSTAAHEAARPNPAPIDEPALAQAPEVEPSVEAPVLASATTPTTPAPAPAKAEPARSPDDLRSPSLLPADTPAANVEAFTNLKLSKRDKAPIAGAGATGIHLDEIELGKGWAASRCEDPSRRFVVDADERVSFCFRVVHPSEAETVTVEWARDAKVRHSIDLNVPARHAYLTRAWMPVTAGRVGHWTATVKSSDGTLLGQLEFDIAK